MVKVKKKIFNLRCELSWTIHLQGNVPFPIAIFLDSGHTKMLALYQVPFIYITSLWYVEKVFIVSISQMWKLRPPEITFMRELGFQLSSSDSKAHVFPTTTCSFPGASISNMNMQNIL